MMGLACRWRVAWRRVLLLLCLGLPAAWGSLTVVDGSVIVYNETDFHAALGMADVSNVLIGASFQLSNQAWPKAVQLGRTLTISPSELGPSNYTVDCSQVQQVVECSSSACNVTVDGMHALNFMDNVPRNSNSIYTPIPSFIRVDTNGTLTVRNCNITNTQPTGLWDSNNIIYDTPGQWTGSLSLACQSPTEIIVHWLAYHNQVADAVSPNNSATSTGYIQLLDVRMLLAPSYVCSNQSLDWCRSVEQICQGGLATGSLPVDTCSDASIARICAPAGYTRGPRPNPDDDNHSQKWWIGLLAGSLAGFAGLIGMVMLSVVLYQRRHKHLLGADLFMGCLPKGGGSGTREGEVPARHPAKGGAASGTASGGLQVAALAAGEKAAGQAAWGLAAPGSDVSEHGRSSSGRLGAGLPKQGQLVLLDAAQGVDWSGFTYRSQEGHAGIGDTSDAAKQLASVAQPLVHGKGVVIQMAANPSSLRPQQLSRNPLGVTISTVLGHGAFGTVYAGLWQGQAAAIKVMQQQVSEPEDLAAILQFREATLGAELDHPRIVRTLAHALIVPDDMIDEEGTLLRPGTVEAHIVSSLCDRGTLKGWLQLVLRAQTALQGAHPSHTFGLQAGPLASIDKGAWPANAAAAAALQGRPQSDSMALKLGNLATVASLRAGGLVGNHPLPPLTHGPSHRAQSLPAASTIGEPSSGIHQPPVAPASGQGSPPASPDHLQGHSVLGVEHAAGGQLQEVVVVSEQRPGPLELAEPSLVDLGKFHSGAGQASGSFSSHATSPMSTRSGSAVSAPSGSLPLAKSAGLAPMYPPLACIKSEATGGPKLHSEFNCHLLAVVDILLEMADGLSYLLSKGVVHGDLKPQNVLLCSDATDPMRGFTVKIADFGISRVIHASKSHTTVSQPPGTLAYFAPELLSTCRLSPACDLYSFGIIMYELLTCRQPLTSLTMAQVLYKKATGKISEHFVYPPLAPQEYINLARSCYSLEAGQRPTLPALMARLAAIRQLVADKWQLAVAPPPPPRVGSFVWEDPPRPLSQSLEDKEEGTQEQAGGQEQDQGAVVPNEEQQHSREQG